MPPFLQFVIRRFLVYYLPRMNPNMTEAQMLRFQETIIKRYHLRESFLIQYGYWVRTLFDGTWGYSPSMNEEVPPALWRRTPITLEFALARSGRTERASQSYEQARKLRM